MTDSWEHADKEHGTAHRAIPSAYPLCGACGQWIVRTAPAEPRWPSGPDAEKQLREAIYAVSVRHKWAEREDREDRTADIMAELAALQEKRDPGE